MRTIRPLVNSMTLTYEIILSFLDLKLGKCIRRLTLVLELVRIRSKFTIPKIAENHHPPKKLN